MNEPRRWLDDQRTSADLRQILEAASGPPPLPPELHARLSEYAVGLASQGVLAKVGGVSIGRKLLQVLGGSGKALTVASLIGAAAVGSYVVNRTQDRSSLSPARSPLIVARPTPSALVAGAERLPLANIPSSPREEPRELEASKPRAAKAARAAQSEPAPMPLGSAGESSARESIADEARLLETARSFLGDSPALALELTEQHRRLHPAAQLSAEREFIAIDALLRLGRRQEAERRAAPRLEQAPDSLYARRLRQLLSPATHAPGSAASANGEKQ